MPSHLNERRDRWQNGCHAASAPATCARCGSLVANDELYCSWCPSCVLQWGHADDAAEIIARVSQRESYETALALTAEIADARYRVTPIAMAVQSVGILDDSNRSKKTIGARVRIDTRTRHTAGDGYLFDDDGGRQPGPMPRQLKQEFLAAIARLVDHGASIRLISRATGLNRSTVRQFLREIQAVPVCKCGQPATHQGWCRPRFQASELRQKFMRRWHPSGQWPCLPVDPVEIAWR